MQGRGRASSAVIGIGMNLRVPDDAVIEAAGGVTDLASLLSDPPDRNALLAALLASSALLETYASAGFVALRGAWLQRNAFAQLPVQLSGGVVAGRHLYRRGRRRCAPARNARGIAASAVG